MTLALRELKVEDCLDFEVCALRLQEILARDQIIMHFFHMENVVFYIHIKPRRYMHKYLEKYI